MSVIKGLAGVLGDRVPSGGRGLPGLRFAGEGIQGEGNQALLEDVSDRALQGRQPRLPPAIRDTRAAPPLQLDTPAPRNAEKPMVLEVTADDPPRNAADEQPLVLEVTAIPTVEDQPKPSQPTLHKQSVEEASAAVMNSLLSRDQARAAKAAAKTAEKAKAKAEAKAAAKEATKADPKAAGTKAGAKAAGKVKPKAKAKPKAAPPAEVPVEMMRTPPKGKAKPKAAPLAVETMKTPPKAKARPKAAPPAEVPVETKKMPSKKRLATDSVEDSSMFRIDHEKSIPQWLLRTGWKQPFGPGSKIFRYIRGDEASEAKKLNECKGFAKKLCLDRGLASPAL